MGVDYDTEQPELDAFAVDDYISFEMPVDGARRREELRLFLVACLQASVSIETMSRYLGLEADIVRNELRAGIEAWNAAQRRGNETAFEPRLSTAAFHG